MGYKQYPVKRRRGLAAQRMRRVRAGKIQGPVLLLTLAEEAHRRMGGRHRGRPSVKEWDLRRMIPVSRPGWANLKTLADSVGLAPAQLAALLIEHGLDLLAGESKVTGGGTTTSRESSGPSTM